MMENILFSQYGNDTLLSSNLEELIACMLYVLDVHHDIVEALIGIQY